MLSIYLVSKIVRCTKLYLIRLQTEVLIITIRFYWVLSWCNELCVRTWHNEHRITSSALRTHLRCVNTRNRLVTSASASHVAPDEEIQRSAFDEEKRDLVARLSGHLRSPGDSITQQDTLLRRAPKSHYSFCR